ncbi:hypothetical protein CR513_51113, partial [Mucuna pruriens]
MLEGYGEWEALVKQPLQKPFIIRLDTILGEGVFVHILGKFGGNTLVESIYKNNFCLISIKEIK